MTRDPKTSKPPGFGKRPGALANETSKRALGRSLGERMGNFFRGLVTGKVAPKIDAKRRKTKDA